MGESNILNKLPVSASNLYAKNVFNFVDDLINKENKKDNLEDEIIENIIKKFMEIDPLIFVSYLSFQFNICMECYTFITPLMLRLSNFICNYCWAIIVGLSELIVFLIPSIFGFLAIALRQSIFLEDFVTQRMLACIKKKRINKNTSANLSAIFYLVSGVLFTLFKGLSSPETSRQGNLFGILGMVIAITEHFYYQNFRDYICFNIYFSRWIN